MGMLTKLAEETAKKPRTRKPKVVPLDAPAPAVVDKLAEQQAAVYAARKNRPEPVVAGAEEE